MLPLFPAISFGETPLGIFDFLGFIITLGAILLELIADNELRTFAQTNHQKETTLTSGVWAYSRHPNYFGELMFWWGLSLFALAVDTAYWWTMIGGFSMTLLFVFISIPMMEKRMITRRPKTYPSYQQQVSIFIPWFPKKQQQNDL